MVALQPRQPADSQKEVPDNSLKPQQSPFPASPDAFHLTSSD